ncbi:vitamin K epoxide reductase family protein [Nitzschia inconspicua]|uniref:Vitamin K epoxide reductase family protein n=1 Tax=Nitzschia inconspicua TaxID=303405 RepID=A0A9K3LQQ3_9STRA|nr:vitamin K epoxide reductase family protein [Nitzschia inconspicua]
MPSSASPFTSRHNRTIPWALLGGILSIYALYVEHMVHRRQTHPEAEPFVALCDIEQIGASCSNVFQLPEGRMLTYFGIVPAGSILDVPNAALGWVYYTIWIVVAPKLPSKLILLVASLAMASSVWLAVQLLMLKELCLLCWSTHVINSRLWWCAFSNNRTSGAVSTPKEKKIKRV